MYQMKQFTHPWMTINRKDRAADRGGGVAMHIANNIPVKIRTDLSEVSFECLWVTVCRNGSHDRSGELRLHVFIPFLR